MKLYLLRMIDIRKYTRRQLSFESYSFTYKLPFSHHGKTNEELLQQTVELLNKKAYYDAILDKLEVGDDGWIEVSFLYEGSGEYHRFSFSIRLAYIEDMDIIVILGNVNQDIHDVFDIIVNRMILPSWSSALGLLDVE